MRSQTHTRRLSLLATRLVLVVHTVGLVAGYAAFVCLFALYADQNVRLHGIEIADLRAHWLAGFFLVYLSSGVLLSLALIVVRCPHCRAIIVYGDRFGVSPERPDWFGLRGLHYAYATAQRDARCVRCGKKIHEKH